MTLAIAEFIRRFLSWSTPKRGRRRMTCVPDHCIGACRPRFACGTRP
jgi:hypothetical protein